MNKILDTNELKEEKTVYVGCEMVSDIHVFLDKGELLYCDRDT